MAGEYMRGRADERASIIAWMEAEAASESLPSWAAAFSLVAKTLSNIAPTSEMVGVGVAPIQEASDGK